MSEDEDVDEVEVGNAGRDGDGDTGNGVAAVATAGQEAAFESLLDFLKESRGFDFTGYKRSSIWRRVTRRMQQRGIPAFNDYLDLLQVDQDEFTHLFNTVLINVTGFLRDPEAWRELQAEIVPQLLATKSRGESVRVWSAGCASGEEAYGLAMVFAEALGLDEFRQRVKVYATDVDEEALATARQATYGERELQALPAEWRERYFERTAGRYTFRSDLRRSVIFGRNDLVQDAPIGRLDLLVCRNTLMYLNAETQAQVLRRFHFALNPSGVMFLGKAEMLLSHGRLFLPIDLKRRFFRKAEEVNQADRLAAMAGRAAQAESRRDVHLEDETLLFSPIATIVVTADDVVAKANQRAEAQLGVSAREIGRRFRDLEICHRITGLRSSYEDVRRHRTSMWQHEAEYTRSTTETLVFDIQIVPLEAQSDDGVSVALFFTDVTRYRRMTVELQSAHRQVETAYEELQSTVEELETTNEELQSTVEELETTNEELQSTVEELETTNEELQSTNDELQSMNDEMRERTGQLDRANDFLESVLGSLRTAVIVVDSELIVQAWNGRADDLWGMRSDEALGQHLLNLDIGLATDRVRPLVRDVLQGHVPREDPLRIDAINRRGRSVRLAIAVSPLTGRDARPGGAIILMDHVDGSSPSEAGPEDPATS
ncbi:CheR family methyltransferase [Actinomycetospora lemnae]|uniref:protein-glutamate O-methyltransferase n=1 Tax=Actinomycetospora lemnae TaxID=3019891 RepID=A0ABT5SX26_9PSEU|nr:CheR family methyltransferase [Actinomycetospora sp. DW7H6]MDD7967344.1 PAS domain-containing protein [Actinomycetospora sp. DW7H6]